MFKEAIKNMVIPIAAVTALLCSCSGSADRQKAQALYDQASSAFEARDYESALALTDSIRRAYPAEIEVRRSALHLATRATEGLTVRHLQEADSMVAVLGVHGDSLQRLMKYVDNPIEGYYTFKSSNPEDVGTVNGLQARVSPDGHFYLTSTLRGKGVKSTSVSVSYKDGSVSTAAVAFDGERNDRSSGAEIITFVGVECDTVGYFVAQNHKQPLTLTFNGSSSYSMPLPPAQAEAIATVYDYATTLRRAKLANIEKERLSRALEISRSQAAKTYVEQTDGK